MVDFQTENFYTLVIGPIGTVGEEKVGFHKCQSAHMQLFRRTQLSTLFRQIIGINWTSSLT